MEARKKNAAWLIICSLSALAAGAALEIFYYPLRQRMESGTFWWGTGIASSLLFLLSAGVLAGCCLWALRALLPGRVEEPIRKILGALLFFILWLLVSSYPLGLMAGSVILAGALIFKGKWGALAALVCAARLAFFSLPTTGGHAWRKSCAFGCRGTGFGRWRRRCRMEQCPSSP